MREIELAEYTAYDRRIGKAGDDCHGSATCGAEEGVPAYIVFSEKVLKEMAAARPDSASAFLAISGVGPAKLERHGAEFLELIARG